MTGSSHNPLQRRHRALAAWCAVVVAGMIGAAYAAVPLYRIFCQATGYDGTPRRASAASSKVIEKTIVVRFDGNVASGLPWRFEPVRNTMTVKVGENAEAHFRATNLSDHRIVGSATYNVAPDFAAAYFDKVECFCFTEQALEAGQTADLVLNFFIDPEIVHDLEARTATHVTVSYTFYPVKEPAGVAEKRSDKPG
ncbi:MAG: cytochrome c oxidase assembly protein [Hyphomicrobiaceae bacterium]|nr:cytochrome c oxidase assembly protein [Hyphomicrobiaceae bacterium]